MMKRFFFPICIQDYNKWAPLEGTIGGAKELYKVLNKHYQYDLLTDDFIGGTMTVDQLWDTLALLKTIPEASQLVVYYSGHGFCAGRGEHAYWITTAGADPKTGRRTNWFKSTDFIEEMADIQVRHILLINDTCLSGQLVRNCCGMSTPIDERPEKTREILSSCDETEYVFDPSKGNISPFIFHLCSLLKNAHRRIECDALHAELKRRLKGIQNPLHIPLYNYGHEHGSFTFKSSSPEETCVDKNASQGVVLTRQVEVRKDIKGNVGTEVDGEILLNCSSVDRIILIWENGKFELTNPPRKLQVGKLFRECILFDHRVLYTAVYTCQNKTTYIKRFRFDGIPFNKQVFFSSGKNSTLDIFVEGTPDKLFVRYRPVPHQRISQQYFLPEEVPICSADGAGCKLTSKQIARIDMDTGAWGKKGEKIHRGVIFC